MSASKLSGGSIRVLWDETSAATVSIAGGNAAFTVGGVAATFPYTLNSSTTFETDHSGAYVVSVLHHGIEIANSPDGTREVRLEHGQGITFAPTPDGTPNSKFLADLHGSLSATYGALDGSANFVGGFKSQPNYGVANTIIVKPSTDTDPGIVEWAHDSPSGYLFHLVSRPNMGDQAALLGLGIDYDGIGVLIANKLNGTGLYVHNHTTATAQAVGISGLQESTAAPMMAFSQGVAGAKALIQLYADATRTAGQQMQVWQNSAQTLGYVEAGGLLRWQHSAYFKQGATGTPALRVEGVTGSTVNAFDVLLPAGGGTPLAVSQTGGVTAMHGTRLRNDNLTSENPLRVTNMSTTANVDTVRIVQAAGQLGDQVSVRASDGTTIQSRFDRNGVFMTRKTAAPADADLATSEMAIWFDHSSGAPKLMVKAKNSSGTVVTGSVALA